ncbi:uncharacterized protein DDB_G0283357-like [Tetranychus urticae]|uniref:uncharacterized protein DDB_G0283357-like n=1 Tax=Tetranychus urticae TaxID=32264 RepID=UPI00077BB360|nr:uncharacterized protein DDB_G0283357-like [Tetranychus urticae]
MNGRSQSSSVPGDSQHIQKNSGDIPSCVDENNRAGSEGSITPTNPDRNSPTYESSKSTVLSYIKREPVQLSALKSTKSYPGSHLAESLYSSTGTLSRLGKPAPPPPVRKTSSISDPNAITLGTLRSAGVSTYEEIKTLKRHSRNRSGGSSFNTYEELNSDKNAIYYAARKSCLSTSLTSLVEPIYSTLDSNNTGTANYYDSKIVTVNSLGNQEKQDASKSYSQIYNAPHHPASSQQSSNDDDVLPPPPPEAYSDSENQHIHPSNTKINCSRREFLQTLNAKLSVFQNQRLSPKLAKRRSMSLPHSDQEWDSDSGITSQSTSSNKSSPRGSTSSHSESFAQSLVKRLSAYGGRNSNSNSINNGSQVDSSRSRANHGNNQSNTNNNSHAIYSSFFFGRNKAGESDSKNVPQNYGHGDVDDYSLSKMKMNSSQHSEVAKAAATEAIRRKKSQSECSLESNIRESNSQINPESHPPSVMHASASENSSSNCMDRIYRSHQHYLSHYNHQHHPSNPFHQNYASENMQTENVYTTRNQSVYQSTSNQPNAYLPGPYSGSHANHQQKIYSQTAMYSAPNSYLNNNGYNPPKGPNNNTMSRSDIGSSVSSSSVEQSQHIQENSGDILSESNRACSEGSITPTNPDRNSPTYESSKSTVLSYIKREPVQLSALKSTKSYPGSHLAESLYSSTGTLSRLGKPAPPPPVRKTSSISDPNAITLGTLRSAGVSTYEEIKTLKRNSRNRSGGSSFNTYEELNSDKNAIYYAARKSCLSTSLTSLVEPIYSTLDSNSTGTANYYDTKSVTVNSLGNQEKQDSSKPYSQIQDPKQHPTSSVAFTVF